MPEATPLLSGLVIGESPRWHEGRLWFAHWGTGEIVAVDPEGHSEVVAHGPPGLGWSIDWLPDGRLLVTGEGLTRVEPDGSMVRPRRPERPGRRRLQRDRRRRPRQHLRQRRRRVPPGRRERPRDHRARHARRLRAPGGRRDRVPQRHDRHARQRDADHRGVLRRAADRVRHRRGREHSPTVASGPTTSALTGSATTPKTRSGPVSLRSPTASSAASEMVARCSSASSSTLPASPACSAARTGGRCSC